MRKLLRRVQIYCRLGRLIRQIEKNKPNVDRQIAGIWAAQEMGGPIVEQYFVDLFGK